MNLNEIRNRLRNGFRPFALKLSSGEQIEVRRPGFMAVGKNIVVVLDKRDLSRVIEGVEIESLHDLPAPGTNKRR